MCNVGSLRERIRCCKNQRDGTVVLGERVRGNFRPGRMFAQVGAIGSGEFIDGLARVPHERYLHVRLGQQFEQGLVHRDHVLRLVDHDMGVAACQRAQDRGFAETAKGIVDFLSDHAGTATHSRHLPLSKCEEINLRVIKLEDDAKLQDLVLTVHHAYMHTFSMSAAISPISSPNWCMA